MENLKLTHVAQTSATDANDPVAPIEKQNKLIARAIRAIAAKLDADAGVTDTNYLATIDALYE